MLVEVNKLLLIRSKWSLGAVRWSTAEAPCVSWRVPERAARTLGCWHRAWPCAGPMLPLLTVLQPGLRRCLCLRLVS